MSITRALDMSAALAAVGAAMIVLLDTGFVASAMFVLISMFSLVRWVAWMVVRR